MQLWTVASLTVFGRWVGGQGVHRMRMCDVHRAAGGEETALTYCIPGGRVAFVAPPSLFICKLGHRSVLGEVVLKTIT